MGGAGGGAAIVFVLLGGLCGLVIGVLVGAVILRAACALYNKIAGPDSPARVPEPELGRAMLIVFLAAVAGGGAGLAIGFVIGLLGHGTGQSEQALALLAQAVSLPVSILIMAGLITALLPTTFGRGLLVTLCYILIALLVGLVIGAIAVGMWVLLSPAR